MKLLNLLTIIYFLFFVACSSPNTSNDEKEVALEETPIKELIEVDAIVISKEVYDNEVAADIKYMDKEIVVTNCKFSGIEESFEGDYFLKVKTMAEWDKHVFFFEKDQMQVVAELKKGQIIQVRGLVINVISSRNSGRLVMKNSIIIK